MAKTIYSEKFKKETTELVEEFILKAKLDFQGDVLFMEEERKGDCEAKLSGADITILDDYLKADINIYPVTFEKWKEDSKFLRKTIAHEISHIITEPLYILIFQIYRSKDEVNRALEQTTEKISRLMLQIKKKK